MADTQMQLEGWLDDLCVRFIINLPEEDLSSVARICFQVEEAQWFYEDFVRPLDPTLPSMSLRTFCLRIFQHCPLLAPFSVENHTKAFEEFLQYKTRVPVRGAIMLNQAMDSVVLVKGWKKGANWSFPRGKINKDEDDLDCAVREVYEETGLDLRAAGLVPTERKLKYIEIAMREQQIRLYVFRNIPMDTNFQPRTRKEISKIQWYKLSELPAFRKKGAQQHDDSAAGSCANKFYMVAPFLVPLKKWIATQKKLDEKRATSGMQANPAHQHFALEEVPTTEDDASAPRRPAAPGQVPAIETLDGATRELQRLLKMQPATQGLQPQPPHQDKGSALLSILQASSPRSQMPQTPLDLTVSEPPLPRNPHHHTNQHSVPLKTHAQEPPPAFHLAANHLAALPNLPQKHMPDSQLAPKGARDMLQLDHPSQQVPLAHSQPLPHQVQRDMFDKNALQEGPSGAHPTGYSQQGNSQTAQGQVPPQAHAVQRPMPVQLNGHSMALLNAFRRDTGPPADENGEGHGAAAVRHPAAASSPYASHTLPRGLPNLLDNSARHVSHRKNPSELAGPVVQAPIDRHRSALLEMFKKTGPDAGVTSQAQSARQHSPNGSAPAYKASGDEKMMLPQQLPGRDSGSLALSLDQLFIQPRSVSHGVPRPNGWENAAPLPQPPSPGRTAPDERAQIQPTRILQRGQSLTGDAHASSPKSSPYGVQAQPRPGNVASPLGSRTMAAPSGELNRRPEASDEQKRQLLSLFSKQQSSQAVLMQGGGGASRPRVAMASGSGEQPLGTTPSASSRRGTETPMSPAEESFLLEYLQAVTNNASR